MANVDGARNVAVKTPLGAQEGVLTVNSDGATFTGGLNGELGEVAIDNGTVDGDTINWKMTISKPMTLEVTCAATVTGDSLEGKVDTGAFGAFGLTGTRA